MAAIKINITNGVADNAHKHVSDGDTISFHSTDNAYSVADLTAICSSAPDPLSVPAHGETSAYTVTGGAGTYIYNISDSYILTPPEIIIDP